MSSHEGKQRAGLPAYRIAAFAVLIAVTAVFTYLIRIPVAPTRGYINFGDVAIFFAALTFGPVTALVSGGVGTAIADIIAGYGQWAPFSFLAHGLQGLVIGLIAGKMGSGKARAPRILGILAGAAAGTVVMGGIYFITGGIMVGFPAAATEIPGNILQNVVGAAVGAPLAAAVIRAYPPITELKL